MWTKNKAYIRSQCTNIHRFGSKYSLCFSEKKGKKSIIPVKIIIFAVCNLLCVISCKIHVKISDTNGRDAKFK